MFSQRIGGELNDDPIGIAIADSGDLYVVGNFGGTTNYGGGPIGSAGLQDVVVARLRPDGTHVWSRRYGSTDAERAAGIAVDTRENVYVVGAFHRRTDWGHGTIFAGEDDGFLLSLSGDDGAVRWYHTIGASEVDHTAGVSTSGDRVCVVGQFENVIAIGTQTLEGVGFRNGYAACLRNDASVFWAARIPGSTDNGLTVIAAEAAGGALVAGDFRDLVTVAGADHRSAGDTDVIVARIDSEGAFDWALTFGGSLVDRVAALLTMDDGTIVVAGTFAGRLSVGEHHLDATGGVDAFVVALAPSGEVLWARRFGSVGIDSTAGLARDRVDAFYFAGSFSDSGRVEGGDLLTSAGETDAFVVRMGTHGNALWSGRFGGSAGDRASSIASRGAQLYLLGAFTARASFGGGELMSTGEGDDAVLVAFDRE